MHTDDTADEPETLSPEALDAAFWCFMEALERREGVLGRIEQGLDAAIAPPPGISPAAQLAVLRNLFTVLRSELHQDRARFATATEWLADAMANRHDSGARH
jgi:hypothetical protein